LHQAVRWGRSDCVDILLGYPDIDKTIRDKVFVSDSYHEGLLIVVFIGREDIL